MADYKQMISWIKKWGGWSQQGHDRLCFKDPVPDGSGYHTNKGVTWTTFKSLASKLGYTATPELFYKMPDDVWGKIFKIGYWDPIWGDQIKSQGIAETMADWAWGAGPGTAVKNLKKYLGVAQTTSMDTATLNLLNSKDEKTFLKGLSDYKLTWYTSLPGQSANYAGWKNRLNDLYKTTLAKIGTTGAISIIAVIALVGIGFFVAVSSSSEKKTVSRESRA